MPRPNLPKKTTHGKIASGPSSSQAIRHRVPDATHDYSLDPDPYPALKTEQGVFTTPPYSAAIKGAWRYKDEAAAKESSDKIWDMFMEYQDKDDFVGADTARKFIQMGRTRSLRYALRPGGKKYTTASETGEKKEMKRTGKVYDQGKLDGANVFEAVLKRCWADGWYADMFERWRSGKRVRSKQDEEDAGQRSVKRETSGVTEDSRGGRRGGSRGGYEDGAEELVEVKAEEH